MPTRFITCAAAFALALGTGCSSQRPADAEKATTERASALTLPPHPFLLMDQAKVNSLRTHENDNADLSRIREHQFLTGPKPAYPEYTIPNPSPIDNDVVDIKAKALEDRMEGLALAYVLRGGEPEWEGTVRASIARDLLAGWGDLMSAIRVQCPTSSTGNQCGVFVSYEPGAEHSCTVKAGNAFYATMIALDLVYEKLDGPTRDSIKNKLWEFVQPQFVAKVAPWKEAVYSIRGLWSLFYQGETAPVSILGRPYADMAVEAINDYRRWQDDMMSDDGVFTGGPGYAYARYGGPRSIKVRFMDVIENLRATLEGSGKTIPSFYKNPVTDNFYEWVYGYRGSPARLGYTFGDATAIKTDTADSYAYRMFKFSKLAQEYALRDSIDSYALRLSLYLDRWEYGSSVLQPAAAVSPSRVFKDGGIWLNAGTTWDDALSGALWNIRAVGNNIYNHSHLDINSLNLTAFGQRLFNNVGYFGSPELGCEHSPQRVNCTECPAGLNCAAEFNNAYLERDARANTGLVFDNASDKSRLAGDGVIDYYARNNLVSFGMAYSGGIDKGNLVDHHQRTLALVQPQAGKTGYFVVFDEVLRAPKPMQPMPATQTIDLYFHGGSSSVLAGDMSLGQSAYKLAIPAKDTTPAVDSYVFFAQEPNNPLPDTEKVHDTILAKGIGVEEGKPQFNKRIRASYVLPASGTKRVITALFPAKNPLLPTGMSQSALKRVTNPNYSGASLSWPNGEQDIWLESDGTVEFPYVVGSLTLALKATFVWARIANGNVTSLMALKATKVRVTNSAKSLDHGFVTSAPISFSLDWANNERWLRLPAPGEGAGNGTLTSVQYFALPAGLVAPSAYDPQNDLPFQFKGPLVGPSGDTQPPTIVSTTPTNGAAGVKVGTKLVITFSEPMDKSTTQGAFKSTALGAFSPVWKSDRELEISSPVLSYAEGAASVAKKYAYQITTDATDVAGNRLAQPYSGSFTTARRFTTTLPYEKPLWQGQGFAATGVGGSTCPCSVTQDNYGSYIGWMTGWPNAQWCKVITGYSLSSLPAETTVESAKLTCSYHSEYQAFSSFGDVLLDHIRYESPDLAKAFEPDPTKTFSRPLGTIFTSASNSGTLDVTSALNLDLEAGYRATQFRFKFATEPANPGSSSKFMRFYFNGAGACQPLAVVYLAP